MIELWKTIIYIINVKSFRHKTNLWYSKVGLIPIPVVISFYDKGANHWRELMIVWVGPVREPYEPSSTWTNRYVKSAHDKFGIPYSTSMVITELQHSIINKNNNIASSNQDRYFCQQSKNWYKNYKRSHRLTDRSI